MNQPLAKSGLARSLALFLFYALFTQGSLALEIPPGTYRPLPVGVSAINLQYQQLSQPEFYRQGTKLSPSPGLASRLLTLKLSRFVEYRGIPLALGFNAGCAGVEPTGTLNGLASTSSCGDPLLGVRFWPYADGEKKRFLGVTSYLQLPVGSYDAGRAINIGENRWRYGINLGFMTPLGAKLGFDLINDIMWYGPNDDYTGNHLTLEQRPLWRSQLHLRYQFSPAMTAAVGVIRDLGGERVIGGSAQGDQIDSTKYRLSLSRFISKMSLLRGEYGADLNVENGFKESSRFTLNYIRLLPSR